MTRIISSISSELLFLKTIFTREIPNLNININNNTILQHLQPYFTWREEILKKTLNFKNSKLRTDGEKELVHVLLFVEYCCSFYSIGDIKNDSFLFELITMFPEAFSYNINNLHYTYYPILNMLMEFCFNETVNIYPSNKVHLSYLLLKSQNPSTFLKLFYAFENDPNLLKNLFSRLFRITFTFDNIMVSEYDYFMSYICKNTKVSNKILEYVNDKIQDYDYPVLTNHIIDSAKFIHFLYVWFEKKLINYIRIKKRHNLYYGYYLLHLFLYKDCEVSFLTHMSSLKNLIKKFNITIFKNCEYWNWLIQVITNLHLSMPTLYKKNTNNIKKIETIYKFFKENCEDKYFIYKAYDDKLAWMICYPNNSNLIHELYTDLNNEVEVFFYQKILHDIVHYGNYNLVINAWYFIGNPEIKYFEDPEFDIFSCGAIFFQNIKFDNALTISVLNKDKRVFNFICEHFNRNKINNETICKTFYNLLIFYYQSHKWKKTIVLKECKYRINVILNNFYYNEIWLSLLLAYQLVSCNFLLKSKDIIHLLSWTIKKCLVIEHTQKPVRRVIKTNELDNYSLTNKFELQPFNKKYKNSNSSIKYNKVQSTYQILEEKYYSYIINKNYTDKELFDDKNIIFYFFIEKIYEGYNKDNEVILLDDKLTDKVSKIMELYTLDTYYLVSAFSKIFNIYNYDIDINPIKFSRLLKTILELFNKYSISKKDLLFYVIKQKEYISNHEILDICIRNGLEYYNFPFWNKLIRKYRTNHSNYEDSIFYKWNLVGKVLKKGILRYRMNLNTISKSSIHIELITKHNIQNMLKNNTILENDSFSFNRNIEKVNNYHPKHTSKNEAISLLKDSTWVSLKVDGVRSLIYLQDLENMHPQLLSQTREYLQYFYFIAEKIQYNNKVIYLIYEIWKKKTNKELTEFELSKFYKVLNKQKNIFNEKQFNTLLKHSNNKDLWMFKPFYYSLPGLDGLLRWQHIYNKYNFIPNDGLIVKTRDNIKYKIKPIHQLSIDLQIKNKQGYDKNNNIYKVVDHNSLVLSSLEGKIVQCIYDNDNQVWKTDRIRYDKKKANPRNIIEKVEEIYKDPYWLYSLSNYY